MRACGAGGACRRGLRHRRPEEQGACRQDQLWAGQVRLAGWLAGRRALCGPSATFCQIFCQYFTKSSYSRPTYSMLRFFFPNPKVHRPAGLHRSHVHRGAGHGRQVGSPGQGPGMGASPARYADRGWQRAGTACCTPSSMSAIAHGPTTPTPTPCRRQSQGFSRGTSSYRGVTHHPSGRYEARVGIPGSRHAYLGLYNEASRWPRAPCPPARPLLCMPPSLQSLGLASLPRMLPQTKLSKRKLI